ncbi:MAG: YetF domain-containing protein [Cyanobacteria bacterium J06607_13]
MDFSIFKAIIGSGTSLLHTLIVGTLAYFGVIVWLRISGKRTLSKWNAFDFIVTIALGSILASATLSTSTSFLQTMTAVGLLVGLQFLITWVSVRTSVVQNLVKSEPTLLLFKGEFIDKALKSERVAKGEVLAAIRLSSHSSIESIDAVILETEGSFSVIENVDLRSASAFRDVRGFKEQAEYYARIHQSATSS